jgi:hypothetical protein
MSAPAKNRMTLKGALPVVFLALIFVLGVRDLVNRSHPAAGVKDTISWPVLAAAKVKDGEASFTAEAQAAAGKKICITGYMFPLQGAESQSHFILSAYQPTCPFCLPGGYAEMIEVTDTVDKIDYAVGAVTLCGVLRLLKTRAEREHGMLYQLSGTALAE